MVGSIYGIRSHKKSDLDNEEHEDLFFNHQQKDKSDDEETEGEKKVTKVNQMMIQRNLRLLLLPQILPKRIRREKFLMRNRNLSRG